MIDERTRKMIEAYLPNPPDPSLEFGEYYYLQEGSASRVIRVYALDIMDYRDGTEYGIYKKHGNNLVRVDAGYGDLYRGVRKSALYDNKEDCRNREHSLYDGWEHLRKIQREEGLI